MCAKCLAYRRNTINVVCSNDVGGNCRFPLPSFTCTADLGEKGKKKETHSSLCQTLVIHVPHVYRPSKSVTEINPYLTGHLVSQSPGNLTAAWEKLGM